MPIDVTPSSAPSGEADRLKELFDLQLIQLDSELAFDNLTQLASDLCDAPVSFISLVDQDQVWFKAKQGIEATHAPRMHSFCSYTIEGVAPLVVEDASADPRFQSNAFVQAPQGIRFYAGIPLVLRSGIVIGSLCVIDYQVRTLSDKQLSNLQRLANQVVALIEARRAQLQLLMLEKNRLVSEQRLAFALEAADIGDWDMDLRTNVARRSLLHDKAFGYAEAVPEWGYDTFLAHVHAEDRARVDACYQRAMAGEGAYDVECRVVWPDQTVHWLWSKGRFYFDQDGKPDRVAGIEVDITERKKGEDQLRASEYRWRFAIEGSGDGLWDWDIPGNQVFYSNRWKAILGIAPDDHASDPSVWERHLHPQDKDRVLADVQLHLEGQTPHYANEHRVLCADGSTKWVLGRGLVVQRDASGKPLRMIGTNADITERMQAADALRVSELALQAISQGVIIAGPDQIITSVNASFTAMTGYSSAEMLGRNCKFLQGPQTDPETVAAIRAAVRRPAEFAGEILNYRKDGTVFWNELTIAPVWGVNGTLVHFIGIMRDISARRAAELQLRHQESQLAQADTLAGLGRWDWSLTAGSASWSDGLFRLYGRDPADGVPAFDDWQETIHPEDQARLAHCIQTALAGASAYHVEFRIFTKDTGQLRYVESRGSSVVDANGRPTNIRGLDWDITERKQAEMALKASTAQIQLLQTCVSRLNDIVLITEAEPFSEPGPRIVFVNDAFVRRTGFTREEAIGRSPRILQGPKTDRKELDRIRVAMERWEPVRAELINYTKAGEEFWIELDIVPVADASGWYTHWVAVERDITERKLAESTLRESEVRRRIATDSGRVAVWESDLKTDRVIWDDNCFALYRIDKENFKGTFEEWARAIHPEDVEAEALAFAAAVAGSAEYDLIFRIIWPDGSIRFIKAHGEVVLDADGVPQRVVGTNWDVTEQKHSEDELRALVSDKNALLKEVHHRVKNNLQVITSLLRLEVARSASVETNVVLGEMKSRIYAMAQLHESLYRSGTFAAVDLGVYLGRLATQAFRSSALHGASVRLGLQLDTLMLGMDQASAAGLVLNELISNCLKHAFPDGRTGEINVELKPDASHNPAAANVWCLRVRDTGVGLPPDFAGKREASLGVQLISDLSSQLGGSLVIESSPGAGACFSVVFTAQLPAPLVMP